MNEQLISFETAKLAKEKGFDVLIHSYFTLNCRIGKTDSWDLCSYDNCGHPSNYNNRIFHISTPTQSLLQKWLREKHHLIIIVAYQYEHDSTPYSYWIYKEGQSLPINQWVDDLKTYEEALELGLQEALKLI